MKLPSLLLAAIAFPFLLIAAEPAPAALVGKWIATFASNQSQPIIVIYVFKAEGGKLTGTASSAFTGAGEISDIKLDKETITFVENFSFDGMPLRFNYTGRLVGDELQLKRVGPGINLEQSGVAKRVKEDATPAPAPAPAK